MLELHCPPGHGSTREDLLWTFTSKADDVAVRFALLIQVVCRVVELAHARAVVLRRAVLPRHRNVLNDACGIAENCYHWLRVVHYFALLSLGCSTTLLARVIEGVLEWRQLRVHALRLRRQH